MKYVIKKGKYQISVCSESGIIKLNEVIELDEYIYDEHTTTNEIEYAFDIKKVYKDLTKDESFERMHFVLGRYERDAKAFYVESSANNDYFDCQPIKQMSKLTKNLLHAIDYKFIQKQREDNYSYIHERLKKINRLQLKRTGSFMYPLCIDDGAQIRNELIKKNIYVPILWPNVLHEVEENFLEYDMTQNILPLPIDHRYSIDDMKYLADILMNLFD